MENIHSLGLRGCWILQKVVFGDWIDFDEWGCGMAYLDATLYIWFEGLVCLL